MSKPGTAAGSWRKLLVFGRANPPPSWRSTRKRPELRHCSLGSRPQGRTGCRPRLAQAPPPAGPRPRSPRGASQWSAEQSVCASLCKALRIRKLRYRRASRGRESAELLEGGCDPLKATGGLLRAGVDCGTAPDSRRRAPRSFCSIRLERENLQDFKEEESAAIARICQIPVETGEPQVPIPGDRDP